MLSSLPPELIDLIYQHLDNSDYYNVNFVIRRPCSFREKIRRIGMILTHKIDRKPRYLSTFKSAPKAIRHINYYDGPLSGIARWGDRLVRYETLDEGGWELFSYFPKLVRAAILSRLPPGSKIVDDECGEQIVDGIVFNTDPHFPYDDYTCLTHLNMAHYNYDLDGLMQHKVHTRYYLAMGCKQRLYGIHFISNEDDSVEDKPFTVWLRIDN